MTKAVILKIKSIQKYWLHSVLPTVKGRDWVSIIRSIWFERRDQDPTSVPRQRQQQIDITMTITPILWLLSKFSGSITRMDDIRIHYQLFNIKCWEMKMENFRCELEDECRTTEATYALSIYQRVVIMPTIGNQRPNDIFYRRLG